MHETVLRLHEAKHLAGKFERSDHLQSIQGKLFEKFTIAFRIGAQTRTRPARAPGRKWRAHRARGIDEGFVRFHFGQRLHAPARLLLRVLDETRKVIVGARAGYETRVQRAHEQRTGFDKNIFGLHV